MKKVPFKKPFIEGLNTLLPVILSILIIVFILNFLVDYAGLPVGSQILSTIELVLSWDISAARENFLVTTVIGLGTIGILITLVGYLTNLSGSEVTELIKDGALGKLPLINIFYPYAKQIVNFFGGKERKNGFTRVVLVEYPKDGIYTLGFLTGESIKPVSDTSGFDCVTIFIPGSPTPFSGWTIFVPREKVLLVSISVNEALRLLVSGGVLSIDQPKVCRDKPRNKRKIPPEAGKGACESKQMETVIAS